MKCPRCSGVFEIISEYYNFDEEALVRDRICTLCNSSLTETFYSDSRYKSDWIDFDA